MELYRATWHESEDTSSLRSLTYELWELGEAYYDLRDFEAARNTYLEMLRYLRKQENNDRYHNMVICYCRLGNIDNMLTRFIKLISIIKDGNPLSFRLWEEPTRVDGNSEENC